MDHILKFSPNKKRLRISSNLYGIFLEDINFACDGGLNANMVNNYSFDGVYFNNENQKEISDPLRFWNASGGELASETEHGLSENSKFARITVNGKMILANDGYNGLQEMKERCAMYICKGERYKFSSYIRNIDFKGSIFVKVTGDDDIFMTNAEKLPFEYDSWTDSKIELSGEISGNGRLVFIFEGKGSLDLDCVSLMNSNYWGAGDQKWRHGKFRRDLVQALADLKPTFMRFPGGCIVEGQCPGNEYNWKNTIGELYERKTEYNMWSEKIPSGGYNQSYQIGFYEYFCLCEDLGMKPLPTLTAGINCQIRSFMRKEKLCPNIPINTQEFYTKIVKNYLDLIEFANDDPETSEWAAIRAKMGHPKPFALERIGIGNENFGEDYNKRFEIIKAAIQEKNPQILCVYSAGASPLYESIYGEPSLTDIWRYIHNNHQDIIVDEHSYHTPAWFIEQANRFDHYKRGAAKVYFGEYAANGLLAQEMRPFDQSNQFDTALGEAAFLTGLERNGDVVEMASYAPLFNMVGCNQWGHNLIDFNSESLCLTTNYMVQKLFSTHIGNDYIPFEGTLPKDLFVSATADRCYMHIKFVNTGKEEILVSLLLSAVANQNVQIEVLQSDDMQVRNDLAFTGGAIYSITAEKKDERLENEKMSITIKSNSVNVVTFVLP